MFEISIEPDVLRVKVNRHQRLRTKREETINRPRDKHDDHRRKEAC